MFGVDFRVIILILVMAYLIYYLGCKNVILEHKVQELECGTKSSNPDELINPKKEVVNIDEQPKKSRELYSKINSIVQDKLGISARELILGR
jgi:hypothetical protein